MDRIVKAIQWNCHQRRNTTQVGAEFGSKEGIDEDLRRDLPDLLSSLLSMDSQSYVHVTKKTAWQGYDHPH